MGNVALGFRVPLNWKALEMQSLAQALVPAGGNFWHGASLFGDVLKGLKVRVLGCNQQ